MHSEIFYAFKAAPVLGANNEVCIWLRKEVDFQKSNAHRYYSYNQLKVSKEHTIDDSSEVQQRHLFSMHRTT
jgi:hypothetical protein